MVSHLIKKQEADNMPLKLTNADYVKFLSNTPAQAKAKLHSLEQAAGGIVLYLNANKTEHILNKKEHLHS